MSAERMGDLGYEEARPTKRKKLLNEPKEVALESDSLEEVERLVQSCWEDMMVGKVPQDPRYDTWRGILEGVQDVEKYRPWPTVWEAYSTGGDEEEEEVVVWVRCCLCDKPVKASRKRALIQHFAGTAHLHQVDSQRVDLKLAVYTKAVVDDDTLSRCIDDGIVSTYRETRPKLSKSAIVFRTSVSRVFHELGIPAKALENEMFRMLIAGKVAGQEMMPEAAVAEAAPAALAFEKELVGEEVKPERNVSFKTVSQPWTPYSIVHDGSDLFKGPLSCTIVRWVDEKAWKIRMRLNTAERPETKDSSAAGVATEIADGFIGHTRPVAVIGDGTNSQLLGMIYASGDNISAVDERGRPVTPTAPPEDLTIPGEYAGQVVVCFPHQLNNAGKRLWGSNSILGKFVQGWRSLVGGYKGRTFSKKWTEACANDTPEDLAWYGKSKNPGSTTRWWTEWEILADILHHRETLIKFVFEEYFKDLNGEDAGNVRTALADRNIRPFILHLAAVRVYGEPLVQITYALESDGFVAPFVAAKLDVIKEMVEFTLEGSAFRNAINRREKGLLTELNVDLSYIERMRDHAKDMFFYLARIMGWKDLERRLETKYDEDAPSSKNRIRDALLARTIKFFEATKVCIPRAPRSDEDTESIEAQWEDLLTSLPTAATGGYSDRMALGDQVSADLETYLVSPDLATFDRSADEPIDSAGKRLWAWWGERKEKWPGLARLVELVALYLPSSAVLERIFNTSTNKLTKLQYSMGSERSTLTFQVAYNEKARRGEDD